MEKTGRPKTALNESVKVVVRCRPLSEKEKNEGFDEVTNGSNGTQPWYERLSSKTPAVKPRIISPNQQVVKIFPSRGAVQVVNPRGEDKMFTFDAAYDHTATNEAIYDEMVRPLVASVLDGFNGCVFAYGQTGTGKTFTMEGTSSCPGLIPRAFTHIFTHIEKSASADMTHLVSCSYVELYLEEVRDLLATDNKKLTIRGQQELSGFYIPDLTSVACASAAEMSKVLASGTKRRAAAATDMNAHSSRSHAVFMVTVEAADKHTQTIRVGKLNLVDLAGSERQRKTMAQGDRLKEAARINQALSALGNVISALAENSPHVPYRDSKLTRILQDSLGGNSRTIMVANLGPAAYNYDETVTTLRYAHRAKAIKNKPVRNEDPKDAKLREYQAEIERLRSMIEQRKAVDKRVKKVKRINQDNISIENDSETPVESEPELAEEHITLEKTKTEELEDQVRRLEDRLVQGGAGAGGKELLNELNARQQVLEQHQLEIVERKRREVEMQQRIELEEETTASVSSTFSTLQQELDHKTQRLKKCLCRVTAMREEIGEQRESHDVERAERVQEQAGLVAQLRRRLLIADTLVPGAGRHLVLATRHNEDSDVWELPETPTFTPLPTRPIAVPTSRRPTCALSLAPTARIRGENILSLSPMPLPPTSRPYLPPATPPRPATHRLATGVR